MPSATMHAAGIRAAAPDASLASLAGPCRCLEGPLVFAGMDGRCLHCGREPADADHQAAAWDDTFGWALLERAVERKRADMRAEGYFDSAEWRAYLERALAASAY